MRKRKKTIPLPLPVVYTKEGKWIVAWCPIIDVATQGRTIEEAQENLEDLAKCYFEDPDTPKPKVEEIISTSVSISTIPVKISEGVVHFKKASTIVPS